jgi:cytochrome P450
MMKDLRLYRGTLTTSPNILIANDADHSRIRRALSHAFSEKALRAQEHLMEIYVGKLVSALRRRAEENIDGGIVDISKWYNFLTFDVLGDLAFGEPFGCLESGGYHPWVAIVFSGFELASYMQSIKRHPWTMPLMKYFLPRELIRKQLDHQKMSFDKAKQRAELGARDHPDFMSYVLRSEDDQRMTLDEMGENANILIVAGSETTATLLSGTTFWLLKNPEMYRKLVKEIRSAFQAESDITLQKVSQLPYLLAALKEGLRMFPPVPSGLPRVTPDGGAFVDGTWLPEKVFCWCCCPWSYWLTSGRNRYLFPIGRRTIQSQTSHFLIPSSLRGGSTILGSPMITQKLSSRFHTGQETAWA